MLKTPTKNIFREELEREREKEREEREGEIIPLLVYLREQTKNHLHKDIYIIFFV